MRDDFPQATKELLAKRVGSKCSDPWCGQPTSGPQFESGGSVNIGVAAHISAASPGGPRYDAGLSQEERIDSTNGIWLCQSCAKLVDNDATRFDRRMLEARKRTAEKTAALALSAPVAAAEPDQATFSKLERLMPELLQELRQDLLGSPTTRRFAILQRAWSYNPGTESQFFYYFDDHDDLEGKLRILSNFSLVRELDGSNVRHFAISEALADYVTG